MRIVLPVQVLRTDKPLPAHAALEGSVAGAAATLAMSGSPP
jgi:hypothetical protein